MSKVRKLSDSDTFLRSRRRDVLASTSLHNRQISYSCVDIHDDDDFHSENRLLRTEEADKNMKKLKEFESRRRKKGMLQNNRIKDLKKMQENRRRKWSSKETRSRSGYLISSVFKKWHTMFDEKVFT